MKNKKATLLLGIVCSWLPLSAEVLNFSEAYNLALEHAHNIQASALYAKAEKEKVHQEDAQLYPQINLSAYYKKSEYEHNPTKNVTRQGLFNYGANARQVVYNPTIFSRIDLQEARSNEAHTKLELQKKELAQELFTSYVDLLKSQNKIALLEVYLQYNEVKLEELEKRYEMMLANKMDLLEMRVERDTSKIDLQKEKRLFEVYRLKFANLIGTKNFELPQLTTHQKTARAVRLMQDKISRRLDPNESLYVKRALDSVDISKYELETAQDEHMPQLSFDAAYTRFDTDDPVIDSQYNSIQYVMLTLNLPLYSGGATESRIESSRLMQQAAMQEMYEARKEVAVMYDENMARFESAAESVTMYNDAYQSAELYVEAIEKGYAHGLKSLTDLNDAKNKLYEVKFNYIENIYELVNSYIGVCIVTNDFSNLKLLDALITKKDS